MATLIMESSEIEEAIGVNAEIEEGEPIPILLFGRLVWFKVENTVYDEDMDETEIELERKENFAEGDLDGRP